MVTNTEDVPSLSREINEDRQAPDLPSLVHVPGAFEITGKENGLCSDCEFERRTSRNRKRSSNVKTHSMLCKKSESLRAVQSLCDRCRTGPWQELATMRLPEPIWTKIIFSVSESHEELVSSLCPLCQFLGSFRRPGIVPESGSLNLRCICSLLNGQENRQTHHRNVDHSPIFILRRYDDEERDWIDEGTFGVLHQWNRLDNLGPRLLDPQRIDVNMVRDWLRSCESSHHDCCETNRGRFAYPFKVVDCQTRLVVQVPHEQCRYASLSYVWQARAGDTPDDDFPPTITDAFNVCLQLGIQYIWIDRYCIDQKNPTELKTLIAAMDRIYAQSVLTIVGAAGQDVHFGLPGVSSQRRLQRKVDLAGASLVEIFDTDETILDSKWATRGWTFQEGFLSRRRLIFVENEVAFLCDHMFCQESVKLNFHPQSASSMQGLACPDLKGIMPLSGVERHGDINFAYLLTEYDSRTLRNPEHVLDACQGIYNGLQIAHLWGMPVTQRVNRSEVIHSDGRYTLNLYWRAKEPGIRREGFPSWSWTGWLGEKDFLNYNDKFYNTCQLEVMENDGKWGKVAAVFNEPDDTKGHDCRIRITGDALPLQQYIVTQDWVKEHLPGYKSYFKGPYAMFPYSNDMDMAATVRLDEAETDVGLFRGTIAMQINVRKKHKKELVMLALKPQGAHYKRIGIIECLNLGVYKNGSDWTDNKWDIKREDAIHWMQDLKTFTVIVH